MRILKYVAIIFVFIFLFCQQNITNASDNNETGKKYRGSVIETIDKGNQLKVLLETGESVYIDLNTIDTAKNITYKVGDKLILEKFPKIDGSFTYVITDFDRLLILKIVFGIFVLSALLIGSKHGLYSLFGMFFSFFVIFKFVLPQIILGKNPILITVISAIFIIPVTFYLSHGFNKKTHIAILSTLITLVLTSLMTSLFVGLARLTGYSSDEAMFLQITHANIDMRGILLAGIIIGFLGILDDVTVSQCSIVSQLSRAKRYNNSFELYTDAMFVGRDHITSMINTLILVYAGASMPLLLLFVNNHQPVADLLNMELVSDEIFRTLLGSIGLIFSVPISTFLSSMFPDD